MNAGVVNKVSLNCAHQSDKCSGDIEEVDIRGENYFLCCRCQTVLRDKLSKAESDGMPGWWLKRIVYDFVGKVDVEEINSTDFLPGY